MLLLASAGIVTMSAELQTDSKDNIWKPLVVTGKVVELSPNVLISRLSSILQTAGVYECHVAIVHLLCELGNSWICLEAMELIGLMVWIGRLLLIHTSRTMPRHEQRRSRHGLNRSTNRT